MWPVARMNIEITIQVFHYHSSKYFHECTKLSPSRLHSTMAQYHTRLLMNIYLNFLDKLQCFFQLHT